VVRQISRWGSKRKDQTFMRQRPSYPYIPFIAPQNPTRRPSRTVQLCFHQNLQSPYHQATIMTPQHSLACHIWFAFARTISNWGSCTPRRIGLWLLPRFSRICPQCSRLLRLFNIKLHRTKLSLGRLFSIFIERSYCPTMKSELVGMPRLQPLWYETKEWHLTQKRVFHYIDCFGKLEVYTACYRPQGEKPRPE
jgi:hypothetical protein